MSRFQMHRSPTARWALGLYAGWTATWCLYELLARSAPLLREPATATLFWAVAKLGVWVAPIVILIRRRFRAAAARWLGLDRAAGLLLGVVVAPLWVVGCALHGVLVPSAWPQPASFDAGIVSAILIFVAGPLFEEVLFRGFALRALSEEGLGFWRANVVSAVLFALLHVPGWLFMVRPLASYPAGLLIIAFDGFAWGAARVRGASLWPCVMLHIVNNAWSGGLFLRAWVERGGH